MLVFFRKYISSISKETTTHTLATCLFYVVIFKNLNCAEDNMVANSCRFQLRANGVQPVFQIWQPLIIVTVTITASSRDVRAHRMRTPCISGNVRKACLDPACEIYFLDHETIFMQKPNELFKFFSGKAET